LEARRLARSAEDGVGIIADPVRGRLGGLLTILSKRSRRGTLGKGAPMTIRKENGCVC
jgi:hypothetical protein